MGCGVSKKLQFYKNIHNMNINLIFQFILILILMLINSTEGDSDWLLNCYNCHCHWNSGKKTADCKNRSLITIPNHFKSELQVLDLSYNQIPEISREQFLDANLPNLHKIYMKNCTILALNRDAFKGLAILFELDLCNNFIKSLPVGIFTDVVRLRYLIMNNNEIEILENDLFHNLPFLSRVEFKNNHIKRIEINSFVNLPALSILYLESNRLSTLKRETFENLPKLLNLNLEQNPWNCTCELQAFRNFTITKNLYTPPTNCYEPIHLRGKLWTEVPIEYFACHPNIIKPRHSGEYLDAISENMTLTCHIEANPQPNIYWMFNKRQINTNEHYTIQKLSEIIENHNIYKSELIIYNIKNNDRGIYSCIAENRAGRTESEIQLRINLERLFENGSNNGTDTSSNILIIICIIVITLLLLLIVIVLVLCWYCRRIRHYTKDSTMSENGLMTTKILDKTQNGSVLEGSVIMEMQKSLLTEVNPVEKPPRRTEIESVDTDDGHEIKKTLLDETPFGSNDEETNSVSLSDTTPRSRATFVDDGTNSTLPPDLLSFPSSQRVPQSPSLQSSMSNIPDNNRTLYGKSPLSSPVYQHALQNGNHHMNIYGTTPSGFRTLQHPKNRNLILASTGRHHQQQQQQSPFIPAPVVYSPVIMKQGYMTIPRKPRIPSWTPSVSTTLSEFQGSTPTSPIGNISLAGTDITDLTTSSNVLAVEPVYDNLGLRTTAGGNSILNLNKIGINSSNTNLNNITNNKNSTTNPIRYTMKDRPLPATPNMNTNTNISKGSSSNNTSNNTTTANGYHNMINGCNNSTNSSNNLNTTKIYEPIHELNNLTTTSDTEPLYGTARSHTGLTIVPSLQQQQSPSSSSQPNSNTNLYGQSTNNNHNNNFNMNINNNQNNTTNNNTNNHLHHNQNSNNKIHKIPPRPPPKPKKKMSVTATGQGGGSTSQLCFEDEGEDGTEV